MPPALHGLVLKAPTSGKQLCYLGCRQVAYNINTVYFIAASIGVARDRPELQESEQLILAGRRRYLNSTSN